ncbi:MAG: hypothetical protein Q7K35_03485 [bacterium]|nr:hypothetical protein [bacterium]
MTPKKAIVILLILSLVIAFVFVFLYISKQSAVPANQLINSGAGIEQTGQEAGVNKNLTPAEIDKQKDEEVKKTVEKIIEQGKNEFGGTTIDAIKAAEAVANQRVQEKLNSRTPEQIEADNKREAEIQRMLEEANSKVK